MTHTKVAASTSRHIDDIPHYSEEAVAEADGAAVYAVVDRSPAAADDADDAADVVDTVYAE